MPLIPELLSTDVFYTFNRGRMYKVPADTILAYILREGTFGVTDGDKGDVTVSASGTVWDIDAGVVGPTELASTAVTPGSYVLANVTVDADGRLTNVSNGTVIIPNADYGDITVSSAGTVWNIDADAVGAAEIAANAVGASEIATDAVGASEIAANAVGASELASTAVTPGSYTSTNLTVDADGRITAASNGSAGASALTTYSFSFSDSFTPGVHTYIQSISGFPTVTMNDIAVSNGYTLSAVDTGSGMTLVSGHKDFRDLTGTITSSYFVDGAGYYFVYYGGYWQIVTRD